jgi:hypothetical protein
VGKSRRQQGLGDEFGKWGVLNMGNAAGDDFGKKESDEDGKGFSPYFQ